MNENFNRPNSINLEPNNRYRLNCTYFDSDGELYWYGKMINVTDKNNILIFIQTNYSSLYSYHTF